jgi:hypothetical protein
MRKFPTVIILLMLSAAFSLPYAAMSQTQEQVDHAIRMELLAFSTRYKKWEAGLEGAPVDGLRRTKEQIHKMITDHAETLLNGMSTKEYPTFSTDKLEEVRIKMFTAYLAYAMKLLPAEKWCALYKQYRIAKDSIFEYSKGDQWTALDNLYKAQCKEKTEKKPGDQARVFEECKEGETIYVCSKKKPLHLELVGNGKNTSEGALIATNETTGAWGVAFLNMVCASTKNMLPPPARNVGTDEKLSYKLATAAPKHVAAIKTAFRLAQEGKLADRPLKDPHELAQLVIWNDEGKKTADKNDDINQNYFAEKIEKQFGRPLQAEEKAAAEKRIDQALEQISFVDKEAADLVAQKPDEAKAPKDAEVNPPEKPEDPLAGAPKDTSPQPGEGAPAAVRETPDCDLICIPAGTTFIPSNPKRQNMTAIESAVLRMMPGIPITTETSDVPGATAKEPQKAEGVVCTPFELTQVPITTFTAVSTPEPKLLRIGKKSESKNVVISCHCQKGSEGKQIKVKVTETKDNVKIFTEYLVDCKAP